MLPIAEEEELPEQRFLRDPRRGLEDFVVGCPRDRLSLLSRFLDHNSLLRVSGANPRLNVTFHIVSADGLYYRLSHSYVRVPRPSLGRRLAERIIAWEELALERALERGEDPVW